MKSANSRARRAPAGRRGLRLSLVATALCLLVLAGGLSALGTRSAASSATSGASRLQARGKSKPAAAPTDRGAKARAVQETPVAPKQGVMKGGADAQPLLFGCANADTAIAIGANVAGSLASGDCLHPGDGSFYDAYTFSGTAGQFVTISMTSTAIDPYLYLVRPNETALSYRTIQRDDIDPDNDEFDSIIVAVLPDTGVYTIMANSAAPSQTGAYQLQVRGGCGAAGINHNTTVGVNTPVTLVAGDCQLISDDGTPPDNSFVDVYAFSAVAGQRVAITMASTAFDTYLFLLSTDGFTKLAFNDDGATGGPPGSTPPNVNSRIPAPEESGDPGVGFATLPASGTYYILATSFSANAQGAYQLQLAVETGLCPTQPIAAGATANGALTASDCRLPFDGSFLDVYTFEGTAGQRIAITMSSGQFDAFLLLYDPLGFPVDENDDGGGGLNARIPAPELGNFITLTLTGTYRIYANAAGPDVGGSYALTVAADAPCTVALTQASRVDVAAAGGAFADNFTMPAGCAAPAIASNDTWITNVTAGISASGAGTFNYTVAQNNTAQSRTGTITVGGQTFSVTQLAGCPVKLSPTVRPFTQGGGAGRFTVVPDNNASCAWTAATTTPWITINTGATGGGTGRVTYTVQPNGTAATRTGTITVNGQTHTVTQTSAGTTPSVFFKFTNYPVSESDPTRSITITVSRLGDTAGASTVEYRTVFETQAQSRITCNPAQTPERGTAFGRCDFATTIDTLTFAAGDVEQTFRIPLVNDVHVEGPETFQIELADPQGATLGSPSTATVTINDDDTTPPTANPVRSPNADSYRYFVRMHYLDFLSREPEAAEPWTAILVGCPNPENAAGNTTSPSANCDRIIVSRSFFESPEFRLKGFTVFLYHKVSFGSAANPNYFPEYRDIVIDMRRVTGRTAAETIAKRLDFFEDFVNRPAFVARYAGMSNADFVDTLLANVNATVTQAGSGFTRDSLVADLNASTKTRAEVLQLIVESPEVGARQFNHAYVAMQYYGYLRRTPDLNGYISWLGAINPPRSENPRLMIDGFVNSTEYMWRFGPS